MEFTGPDKGVAHFPLDKPASEQTAKFDFNKESHSKVSTRALPSCDDLLENAEVLIRNGELNLAKNLLGRSLQFYPKNLKLLNFFAEVSVVLEDWPMVAKAYECIVNIENNEDNIIKLSESLQKIGSSKLAKELLLDLLARQNISEENQFQVYKDLGNLSVGDGDFETAEEFYNKAFAMNPDSDVLLVNYGTLELQRCQLEDAGARFRSALALNTKNARAWLGLALVHKQFGDDDLALGNVIKSLDYDPNNSLAMKTYVEWCVNKGMASEALEKVSEFLEVNDQNSEFALIQSQLFFVVGRFQHAKLAVEKSLVLDPKNANAAKYLKFLTAQEDTEEVPS